MKKALQCSLVTLGPRKKSALMGKIYLECHAVMKPTLAMWRGLNSKRDDQEPLAVPHIPVQAP